VVPRYANFSLHYLERPKRSKLLDFGKPGIPDDVDLSKESPDTTSTPTATDERIRIRNPYAKERAAEIPIQEEDAEDTEFEDVFGSTVESGFQQDKEYGYFELKEDQLASIAAYGVHFACE
jgi:hypothetical protein